MAIRDLTSERLYVPDTLIEGARVAVSEEQVHYLLNVLRMKTGAELLLFNGRDGEWRSVVAETKKRSVTVEVLKQERPQSAGPDVQYLFAPLKHARLDYMVQKAVEMGVARLSPVITRRTVPERINLARMRANAIEAAEQCGVLRVPEVDSPVALEKAIDSWDPGRLLVFCDEDQKSHGPIEILKRVRQGPLAVLVGPEGGFTDDERHLIRSKPFTITLSLGPRIMRADTAAVAALALVNATLGDWV